MKLKTVVLIVVSLLVGAFAVEAFYQSQNFYTVGVRNKLNLLAATTYIDASVAGSYVKGNAAFAKIDSFTTTALLDTTVMTGADVGDLILVTSYTPLYSATPDTNMFYSAYVLNTDSVVVKREKASALADAKSGGQYTVFRIEL